MKKCDNLRNKHIFNSALFPFLILSFQLKKNGQSKPNFELKINECFFENFLSFIVYYIY